MSPKSIPDARTHRLRFKRRLVAWFRQHGRDLPWRRTRDPYQVLVSEVMLQQTQVSRVEGYWHRFLDRFPTIQHLAAARRNASATHGPASAIIGAQQTCMLLLAPW